MIYSVTVAILCFNAQDRIRAAIDSALNQDYPNFNILIVDDASNDETQKILNKYKNLGKVSVIFNPVNIGPGASRRLAIQHATGDFIVFFDDDDVSHPSRVRIQAQYIRNYEEKLSTEKVVCYASEKRLYQSGYHFNTESIGCKGRKMPAGPAVAKFLLAGIKEKNVFFGSGTPTSTIMIRRTLVENVGSFDPALRRVEDIDLAIKLALEGCIFIGCPEVLVERYMRDASHKTPELNLQSEQYLVKKYKKFLLESRLFYHAFNWPLLRFYHFKKRYLSFTVLVIALLTHNPVHTLQHLFGAIPKRYFHERNQKREV